MTHTTPPRPMDIEAEFPELSGYRKVCTRLHPRAGTAGRQESSVGGPFLWPQDEPWPTCRAPHPRNRGRRVEDVHAWRRVLAEAWRRDPDVGPSQEERDILSALEQVHHVPGLSDTAPVPLLPVAQLFVRDIPGLVAPPGCDLLQVLWCPFDSHGPQSGPGVLVQWRSSSGIGAALAEPPLPEVIGDAGYVPEPCLLDPEQVVEHEYQELLSETLQEQLEAWEAEAEEAAEDSYDDESEFVTYHHDLSIAPGWKIGGYASWNVTGPSEAKCSCGESMQLLLKIDSREWDSGTLSWVPLEDRELINESEANAPTQVTVGRGGSLNIFSCPADPAHEHKVILQG
ncbi:hypothetical protein ACFVYM_22265 [Streptomyces sp. NPDC058298]|uniref:hypothetical protein n=2 Tax=unclassified Streptomyces TaxID=2593676 RepID=UPI0036EE516A